VSPGEGNLLVRAEDLDVSRAFIFFLDDAGWPLKVIVGTLMMVASLLVVPFFIVLGYQCELVRRVARGDDSAMPEWVDIGRKFKDGAAIVLINLVYGIPLIVTIVAVSLLGVLASGTGSAPGARGVALGLVLLAFIIGWLVTILYGAMLGLASPALVGTYVRTGSIRQALQPGVIIGLIKADIKAYLVVFLLTAFVTSTIAFLGFFALCVGIFLTTFYAVLVNGHLIGQLARLSPVIEAPDATR
jgi:hypothetical protein